MTTSTAVPSAPEPLHDPAGLRVLHVDHTAVPGGGQLGLARFIENAPRGRHAVAFLTGGPIAERIRKTGAPVAVRLPDAAFAARRDLHTSQRWLRHVVASFAPDVVVANSAAAAKAFAPLLPFTSALALYYMRSAHSAQSNGRLKSFVMDSLYYRHYDAFLANSMWTSDSRSPRLRSHAVEIAYPVSGVVDDAGVTADRPVRHDEQGNRIFRIVSLSRFEPGKGHLHLLQAADLAQKALETERIRIAVDLYGGDVMGNEQYSRRLHAMAQDLALAVEFHGHVSDVNSRLDQAECLILSSDKPEPFGQVVVQSMSRGALTIVPEEGGPSDVITPGVDGLTYPLGDVSRLAQLIVDAARRPDECRRLASAGLERSQSFTDSSTAEGLMRAIETLHQTRSRRR